MKPPSGGPTTGPIRAGADSQAMAATSSDFAARSEQHQPPDRNHHGAADALQDARTRPERAASSARPHSTEPKVNTSDRGAEHGARAEAVGHPAAHGNEHGKAEQIRCQRHVHPHRLRAERTRHGRAARSTTTVLSRFCMNSAQATISAVVARPGRGARDAGRDAPADRFLRWPGAARQPYRSGQQNRAAGGQPRLERRVRGSGLGQGKVWLTRISTAPAFDDVEQILRPTRSRSARLAV